MLTSTEPRPFPHGCPPLGEAAAAALPDGMARRAARGDYDGVLVAAKAKAGQVQCVPE